MRILFAYDGSESADTAVATAGMLLGRDNAGAVVLTVSFGSVSAHVLQHASRPVLVLPWNGTRPG
jgi:nucleotide-binding universal stress UspA family protein